MNLFILCRSIIVHNTILTASNLKKNDKNLKSMPIVLTKLTVISITKLARNQNKVH